MSLEKKLRIYFRFDKVLNTLWQKFYAIGRIFIVENGQIWSHWMQHHSTASVLRRESRLILKPNSRPLILAKKTLSTINQLFISLEYFHFRSRLNFGEKIRLESFQDLKASCC